MLHHEYAWKGVADGLAAVARVRPRVPGLRLVGFGVKPPRGRLAYDEFHANPPQAALAALYSGARHLPVPLLGRGARACPRWRRWRAAPALVTYDNGGCRDYARDGETALVAPRRDVEALAAALGAARDRRGAAGADRRPPAPAHVTTAFDWDRAVARLAGLFRRTRAGADRA